MQTLIQKFDRHIIDRLRAWASARRLPCGIEIANVQACNQKVVHTQTQRIMRMEPSTVRTYLLRLMRWREKS